MRRPARLVAILALGTIATACSHRDDAPARTLALAECRLPRFALVAQCGEVDVPEDRTRADGRRIRIAVAVLPANTLNPQPDPLFVLAGGPGQAASNLGPFAALLQEVRKHRDLVLVDQRGTGRSSKLDCPAWRSDERLETAIELDPLAKAKACLEQLRAAGIDPAQYTTAAFVADLDAVRAALGYERVNLWGGSYGTRVALEYLRRHPTRVRSMVLDGAVPPQRTPLIDVWPTREAALAALDANCEASPMCRRSHRDFARSLAAIEANLGATGRDVALVDPRTGEPHTLRLTFEHVLAMLQPALYLPELSSLLPEALARASGGEYEPLVAIVAFTAADRAGAVNPALHFSVTCTDDAPRLTAPTTTAALEPLATRTLARRALAVCDMWPRGAPPPDAAQPVASDVPVLLLSGGLDPVTPPTYADEVSRTLSRSRHIVAKGYGHIVSMHACAPRLIAAFVDDPSFASLPAACVTRLEQSARPPPWPDRLGPAP